MSIAQYVGARYVPIFYEGVGGSNDWKSGVAYEPLTIVTYAGNSYTSKKAVPSTVGAPNLNTDYWVSTGTYNAQVEEIRQQMVEVIGDLGDLQTQADNTDETVSGITADISELRTDVASIRGDIIPITGDVVFIGDSYLEGYTPDGNVTDWGTILAGKLGKTIGTDAYRYYKGGCGFQKAAGDGTTFITLVNTAAQGVSDANKVRLVIIGGGANETGDVSTIALAVKTCVNRAKQVFPNAVICVANVSLFYETQSLYNRAIIPSGYKLGVLDANGIYLVDATEILTCFKDKAFANDARHANAVGQGMIASAMYTSLKGGNPKATRPSLNTAEQRIVQCIVDGVLNLESYNPISYNPGIASYNCDGNTLAYTVDLGTQFYGYAATDYFAVSAPCFMQVGGSYFNGFAELILSGRSLKIYLTAIKHDGSGYASGALGFFKLGRWFANLPMSLL